MPNISFDLQRFAITNYDNNKRVNGTTSDDTIYNYGSNVTVNSSTGDDVIGDSGSSNKLNAGTGDDSIYLFSVSSGARTAQYQAAQATTPFPVAKAELFTCTTRTTATTLSPPGARTTQSKSRAKTINARPLAMTLC